MKEEKFSDQKCRRVVTSLKLLIKEKFITDLCSVAPDKVGNGGPMQVEVDRRRGLPADDGARFKTEYPTSTLMKAARYLSDLLEKSWDKAGSKPGAPSVKKELSTEAGVLREPAHQSPSLTDSIHPPHCSDGSRCGSLGCDGRVRCDGDG